MILGDIQETANF